MELQSQIKQNSSVTQQLVARTTLILSRSTDSSRAPTSILDLYFSTQTVCQQDVETYKSTHSNFVRVLLRSSIYRRTRKTQPAVSPAAKPVQNNVDSDIDEAPFLSIAELDGFKVDPHIVNQDFRTSNGTTANASGRDWNAEEIRVRYEELSAKYSKVKRYCFETDAKLRMFTRSAEQTD